jgi:carbon monoxide dehydrogenase subunit G
MPAWALTIHVDAPPDEVWAFIGDPTTVTRWYPKYVSCEVDGDSRTLVSDDGRTLRERLLERDDARRFYSYSVLSGAPVASHMASFEVTPDGDGSLIRWATVAEPSDPSIDLEQRLHGSQSAALERVRDIVEAGRPPA